MKRYRTDQATSRVVEVECEPVGYPHLDGEPPKKTAK